MSERVVTIVDESSGTLASIHVRRGFNCFSLRAAESSGGIELLWSDPDFADRGARASGSGIPVLFPFPGRIARAAFRFDGRAYRLAAGDGLGNAIHGFVLDRPWEIESQQTSSVRGVFHASRHAPEVLESWPADFRITIEYTVTANRLACRIDVANPTGDRLPFGLGVHPYFRAPLGETGALDDCRLNVPAREVWELAEMVPTGRRLQAEGRLDLVEGHSLAGESYDNVLAALEFDNGRCVASVVDPVHGRSTRVSFSDGFRECVVYVPPHREAVCIEPYTCVPDPFAMLERDIDGGLAVLAPGEGRSFEFEIALVENDPGSGGG